MNIKKSPLVIAIGTTLFSGLAVTSVQAEGIESTDSNPFAMTELSSGYMFVAEADKGEQAAKKMKDGSCGEGMCGAGMMPKADLEKTSEGKCAGNKAMPKAKKEDMKDMKDMEGKCGTNMK
ncbi:hypothetical protein AU255_04320 [Methyloprofundus sedimenti]|uniref:Low-complexity protein n=1 Tax=Methyloprofundus sedimenti TaxID=1420851 RepID=A0A1V8M6G7_9GAMM|nr:hypothetical protein [Methyloprofundus sedimenti]OQK17132.1 hypothetical protein AU255_04320 [Methyloprofundus sedimenti]